MRPEISALMRYPAFYPSVVDGETVKSRPPVQGMASPVFYWYHREPEAEQKKRKLVSLCMKK